MEIIIGKTAGFCFGVSNAVNKTKDALIEKKHLYCLGELVHNKEVTKELQAEGTVFINKIEEAKENVIIRAHGEPKKTYEIAKELGLQIIDLTCPKVIKIHDIATKYAKNGFYIFLIGQKNHAETIGTKSYCGKNADVIEKKEDLTEAINNFKETNIKKLLIISQTTFSLEEFESISKKVKELIEKDIQLEIRNTICSATKLRQEETNKISKEVEAMIIIGGKHSSNTNKLFNIAKCNCENTFLIENEKELNVNNVKKYKKIGIMAGASTPQKSIKSVVELLNAL